MSVLGKRDQSSTLCDLYIRTHVLNETLLSVFNNDQKRAVALVRRILSFVVRDRKRDRFRLVAEIRSREGSEGIMICVPNQVSLLFARPLEYAQWNHSRCIVCLRIYT